MSPYILLNNWWKQNQKIMCEKVTTRFCTLNSVWPAEVDVLVNCDKNTKSRFILKDL